MQEGNTQANWQFNPDSAPSAGAQQPGPTPAPTENATVAVAPSIDTNTVSWTASEYVSHEKNAGWYVRYALASLLIIAATYILTREYMSVVFLGLFAVAFGVFAGRKPDVLQYTIDAQGIRIGQKVYPISLFRSFAIIQEGVIHTIMLIPLKRFMPTISIYFAPDDEAKILKAFGGVLPQETREQDTIDRFMHHIRF